MQPLIGFDATPLEAERRSGVGHYVAHLLESLAVRRDDWRYALLSGRRLRGTLPPAGPRRVGARFANRWLWMQIVLPVTLARLRPDLCHFTNSAAPIAARLPFVLSLYDLSLFLHPRTQPLKSRLLIRSLIPGCARRAAAVIAPTESARADIVAVLGLPAGKIHVVPGAAAPCFARVTDRGELQRVVNRYRLPDRFVLFVGTLEPRKNLDGLVRAFTRARRQGRREQLVIAGQLGWKYTALLRQVEAAGLEDAVRLIGYVPDDDLPALYTLARLFAFPSHYEGFGLPIVESMACGTPVLTSNRSATAEVAGGAAMLVDPLDEEGMADGLARCLGDEELRERLACAGLSRASAFSWDQSAAATAAIYRHVLAAH